MNNKTNQSAEAVNEKAIRKVVDEMTRLSSDLHAIADDVELQIRSHHMVNTRKDEKSYRLQFRISTLNYIHAELEAVKRRLQSGAAFALTPVELINKEAIL